MIQIDLIHLLVVATIPAVAFITMCVLWFVRGRDEDGDKAVSVEWSPPAEVSPGELSAIYSEGCTEKAVVAMIIDLAARGHITIHETGLLARQASELERQKRDEFEKQSGDEFSKSYDEIAKFVWKSDPVNVGLSYPEKVVVNYLFGDGYQAYLQGDRSDVLKSLDHHLMPELVSRGYFPENPNMIRMPFGFVGACIMLCAVFLAFKDIYLSASLIIALAIVFGMAKILPAKSKSGSKVVRNSLAYKRYVDLVEGHRVAACTMENPQFFGRLYAYSLIFDLTDDWMNRVHDMPTKRPSWFVLDGHVGDEIGAVDLIRRLNDFSQRAQESFAVKTQG